MWVRLSLVGAALAIAVVFVARLTTSSHRLRIDRSQLEISTVERGEFRDEIAVIGNVSPRTTIYLDATEGGRVETVYLEAGSRVSPGDAILVIDNTELRLDVMYREAELFQQINNLLSARLAMERNRLDLESAVLELEKELKNQERLNRRSQQLYESQLISQEEFEAVEDQYEYLQDKLELARKTARRDEEFRRVQVAQLEDSVARMEANLEVLKQKTQNLTVRAPAAGQLTALDAEVGESKAAGARLGQIDISDGVKIKALVEEHHLSRVAVGNTGEFELSGVMHRLVVEKIYPEVKGGRFEIDLGFVDPPPDGIRRGQAVHLRLEVGEPSPALLLARGGYSQQSGAQWAFVLDKGGAAARRREIEVGRQNPSYYEVLSGLEAGEQVITSSYAGLSDYEELLLEH